MKGSPPETAQKQQESELANRKLGSQIVSRKTKKMKEKTNEVTEPENNMDELCSPEDLPLDDLMEQEKRNKKKLRLKEVPSKESDKEEEQSRDTASRATKKSAPKMEKKNQKSNDMKTSKSLKDANEHAKTSKSLKGVRKVTQGSGKVKEMVYVEAVMEQSQEQRGAEHADAEDHGLFSGNLIKVSCCMLLKCLVCYYRKVNVNVSKCIRCS